MTTKAANKTKKTAAKKSAAKKSSAKKAALKKQSIGHNGFKFHVDSNKDSLKTSILNHLRFTLARDAQSATKDEWWTATCYAVRDRLLDLSLIHI